VNPHVCASGPGSLRMFTLLGRSSLQSPKSVSAQQDLSRVCVFRSFAR
jgi:hypothetical protein